MRALTPAMRIDAKQLRDLKTLKRQQARAPQARELWDSGLEESDEEVVNDNVNSVDMLWQQWC